MTISQEYLVLGGNNDFFTLDVFDEVNKLAINFSWNIFEGIHKETFKYRLSKFKHLRIDLNVQ